MDAALASKFENKPPQLFTYQFGTKKLQLHVPPSMMERCMKFDFQDSDIIVAAYPKSGM